MVVRVTSLGRFGKLSAYRCDKQHHYLPTKGVRGPKDALLMRGRATVHEGVEVDAGLAQLKRQP